MPCLNEFDLPSGVSAPPLCVLHRRGKRYFSVRPAAPVPHFLPDGTLCKPAFWQSGSLHGEDPASGEGEGCGRDKILHGKAGTCQPVPVEVKVVIVTHAKLIGCPQSLEDCVDSGSREYLPCRITSVLSSLAFVRDGLNICILDPSDSGKTHLAKAIGIAACKEHKVEYHHCESFLEDMVALKNVSYEKYKRKLKLLERLDLLILDDFLLHTITDEREVKVLFMILEKRCEALKSTIVCSQREPKSSARLFQSAPDSRCEHNRSFQAQHSHYTLVVTDSSKSQASLDLDSLLTQKKARPD